MSFNDFLKEQNSLENSKKETKRQLIISEFNRNINQLYDDIENNWLHEYISENMVHISKREIAIVEENLGEYRVNEMHIKLANKDIVFIPRGINMIGTNARIDIMYLGVLRALLVRAGEKVNSSIQMINISLNGETMMKKIDVGAIEWKIVKNTERRVLIKLTKESLENTLMDIINNG